MAEAERERIGELVGVTGGDRLFAKPTSRASLDWPTGVPAKRNRHSRTPRREGRDRPERAKASFPPGHPLPRVSVDLKYGPGRARSGIAHLGVRRFRRRRR